jgi:hypothetical protein
MTILPRWFQVSFLALAGVGLAYVGVMYVSLHSSLEDLSEFSGSEITEVIVLPQGKSGIDIPTDQWEEIRAALADSDKVSFAGWKGEEWTFLCTLMLRVKDTENAYLLELKTRPSLDGNAIFALKRGGASSQWVYSNYDGNSLLNYLQIRLPGVCND